MPLLSRRLLTSPFALAIGSLLGAGLLAGCDPGQLVGPPMEGDPVGGGNVGGGLLTGAGGGSSLPGGGGSGTPTGGTGSGGAEVVCPSTPEIGRAPLRRLTRFEYNRTVDALLDAQDSPGEALPAELLGNGFGNDADAQPVSSVLVEQYASVGLKVAEAASALGAPLERYAPCLTQPTPDETSCTQTFVDNFGKAAYRRPLEADEKTELLELQAALRELGDYRESLTGVVEAVLQSPDFLYRIELGEPDAPATGPRRPTAYEMATRLSYFFWGAPPDAELEEAAVAGELSTDEGVRAQAERLLADDRSRELLKFFFSHYLPIEGLTDLARDKEKYPTFSAQIGSLMQKETLTFLEYEIFEGSGTWTGILTAPYTFANRALAEYYGASGPSGDTFEKLALDPAHRKGLLTQGSILTGTTVSNFTNPVRRGTFLLKSIMCQELPDPPESLAGLVVPPNPDSGKTGRERYSAHSEVGVCAECHQVMDPPGFALENYDAVGLWRDQENGVTIDASGSLEMLPAPFNGPIELVDEIAAFPATNACFAKNWLSFASGRSLTEEDVCQLREIETAFVAANYNVQELLLRIATSDAFTLLPAKEQQ